MNTIKKAIITGASSGLGKEIELQKEYKKEDVCIIGFYLGGFKSQPHIKAKSGLDQKDLMDSKYLAGLIINMLELPQNIEVSEIIVNREKNINRTNIYKADNYSKYQ